MINYIYKSILLIIAFLFAIRLLQLIKYFEFLLCTSIISIAVAKCVLLTLSFLTKIIFLLFSIDFKIYYFFLFKERIKFDITKFI